MRLILDPNSIADYRTFLKAKSLPAYSVRGCSVRFPDEYASRVVGKEKHGRHSSWEPSEFLYDYQKAIAAIAIRKRKYAVFADCGLGKTLIIAEFAREAAQRTKGRVVIVSPLMVVSQTIQEWSRFYGETIDQIPASGLQAWLNKRGAAIGITNYEAIREDVTAGKLSALILDESSLLKNAYGTYGQRLVRLGKGIDWKLCATGTPAPNDRIEYGTHSVFLDRFPTVNAFLARFFVNRGQTDNRWELKPHALRPFYRALSDWCIFLSNPATYGWKDNCGSIPPIKIHIQHVDTTAEQDEILIGRNGELFATKTGGITGRSQWSQIAKGWLKDREVATNKYPAIRELIASWPKESTIIWCWFNKEQDRLEQEFPDAASIRGETKLALRLSLLDDFKAGRRKVLISKPDVLGFGLNLQVATRQVFSSLIDSYEAFYQCIKRSNRIGSTMPLNVHIPILDIERPMVETVLRKMKRVESDTIEQEELFKDAAYS